MLEGNTMKIALRVELDNNLAETFLKIKERLGIKNNTEVIRALIKKVAQLEDIV